MEFKDRNEEAEIFFNLLKNIKDGNEIKNNIDIHSYNICLNARWGDGKTTFINEFLKPIIIKRKLYDEKQIIIISAWEYDYLDNPLELIFDILYKHEKMRDKIIKTMERIIKNFGNDFIDALLESSIPKWICIPLISAKKTMEKEKQKKIKNTQNILKINYVIQELNKSFTKSNSFSNYEYLIIIEDLDRCKPEFAKKLLEICKHIFNSKCFTMIFVCDWELINMMTSNNKNREYNELYLDRIIDFIFNLEKINTQGYFFIKYISKIGDSYTPITSENYSINKENAKHKNYFHQIVNHLSIREQNIIYQKILKFFYRQENYYNRKYEIYPELYQFLLCKLLNKTTEDNNIFISFFEKNVSFSKSNKEFIVDAIFSTLQLIETGPYDFFRKENLFLKSGLLVNEVIKFSTTIDDDDSWLSQCRNQKLALLTSTNNPYSLIKLSDEIFNNFKRSFILKIIYEWFISEFNRY